MASSVSLSEEDLNCPICFEEYNLVEDDRMPKLLLCLHTVCFTCLENLVTDDETVRCPICRTEHQIDEDLEDFLDNDAVITHIRSKQEEEDKKAALEVYWKEWLEKCSDEIPDEELRANVQDLVRNSLIPLNGQPKSPSRPGQQDLKRIAQEKQEEEYRHQQQLHQQHQRLLDQHGQAQQHRQVQQHSSQAQQHSQQHNRQVQQQSSQVQQHNQQHNRQVQQHSSQAQQHSQQHNRQAQQQQHNRQVQQQSNQAQQHNQQHNRQVQQRSQSQQPNQEQENFNWSELLGALGQFFGQFDEINNPPSANERQDQNTNQNSQEAREGSQQPHQEQGLLQIFEEDADDEEEDDNTEDYDYEGDDFYDEADYQWYDYSDFDDDDEEEVVTAEQSQHSQTNEPASPRINTYNLHQIVNANVLLTHSDDGDDEAIIVTSDSDDEVEVVSAAHLQQNHTNQSAATRVGRKIFITADTVNKFTDVDFIRSGFEELYGSVQWINAYTGTERCPCHYAILEFKNNVWFVEGEYNIDGEVFRAKLCSGAVGKVFVARLPLDTEDDEITEYFDKFGSLTGFHRPSHHITGDPVTYCFLTFTEEESEDEVLKYEDHFLGGCRFVVKPHINR